MPKVRVQLPPELGGVATINIRPGETPEQAIDRRLRDIGSHQVTDEDVGGTFREGMGAGMVNTARQLGNMAQLDKLGADFFSDESIAEQSDLDKYLTWGHGGGGKLTGELIASAPLGAGVGGAAAKASTALRAGGRTPQMLSRALGSRPGRMGVEGAVFGATFAGPENRGAGAALGGVLSPVIAGAGGALAKTLKDPLVKVTKEAKELMRLTGHFIPLSHSAEAGLVKQVYSALWANFPGVSGKIRGQYEQSLRDLRKFVSEHAMPDDAWALNKIPRITGRESAEQLRDKIKVFWDQAFDEVKMLPDGSRRMYRIFKDANLNFTDRTKKELLDSGLLPEGFRFPNVGDDISGASLLDLSFAIGQLGKGAGGRAAQVRGLQKSIGDILKRNLNPTGKGRGEGARILREYDEATRYWPSWKAFNSAVNQAKDLSEFLPTSSAKLANKEAAQGVPVLPGQVGRRIGEYQPLATQRRVSQLGADALESFPSREGLFQTVAALGLTGSAVAGAGVPAALGLIATAIIGRGMVSKRFQKYLMGETRIQRLNRTMIRQFREELKNLGVSNDVAEALIKSPGAAVRRSAVIGATDGT